MAMRLRSGPLSGDTCYLAHQARYTTAQCRYTCSSVYRITFLLSQMSEGAALGCGASAKAKPVQGPRLENSTIL
jgi:hypothetical protein